MPVSRLIRLSFLLFTAAIIVAAAQPALAQNSARIFGAVTDHEGSPIEGATVLIEFTGGLNRSYELTTNEDGEYVQIGLASGPYNVTTTAEGLGSLLSNLRLSAGQEFELDVEYLEPGAFDRAGLSAENLAKLEAAETTSAEFADGVAAAQGGDLDEAARAFNEAATLTPTCGDCFRNLGIVEFQRENYESAETALRRATEIDPDDAAAFDALADLYNAQRRFDEAGEASAAATQLSGGAGNPGAVFDQGLIAWNAGRVDEARGLFEQTLALDPNHGEANYWMGMASLNGGQIPEAVTFMRTYLEREPNGRFTAEATALLSQLAP
jgi:tetratricopeptide (TPR) repeat protein